MLAKHRFARFMLTVITAVLLASAAIAAALAAESSVDRILEPRDFAEAETSLTSEVPYRGSITRGRIIRLPISTMPGEYTITIRAGNPRLLDPLLILTRDDNTPLAYNDNLDGQGLRESGAFDARITWRAQPNITYYVYILHANGELSEGSFTVTLELATSYSIHPDL